MLSGVGSATASTPGVVALLVSPAGISDQTCIGTVTISDLSTGQSQQIPVSAITVSAQTQSLLLTQAGLNFQVSVGGAPPSNFLGAEQRRRIGELDGLHADLEWRKLVERDARFGHGHVRRAFCAINGFSDIAGTASGRILRHGAGGVDHGGQQPAIGDGDADRVEFMPPPPPLTPSGVILVGLSSGVSEQETVTLFNPWSSPLAYSSNVVDDNRGAWLTASPASGTLAAGATSTMTLQASTKGLTPGLQHGVVRVAFADGTVHTVDVYLIVPTIPAASLQTSLQTDVLQPDAAGEACPGSSGLAIVFRSPEPGFEVMAQTPVPLQVTARDCTTGKVVRHSNGASVQVSMGPQDPAPMTLIIDDGAGNWTGTWTPASSASQMNLIARIDEYVGSISTVVSAQDVLTGTVDPPPAGAAGVVTDIVNGASFQYPGSVTPGAWVSVFGVGIGTSPASAQAPFPSNLGGTKVLLQGQPLSLDFVNETQVNALIPWGVNTNERQQLVVVRNGTRSPSVDVRVANLQPGIFTVNQQGTGQGAITVGTDSQIAAPSGVAPGGRPASWRICFESPHGPRPGLESARGWHALAYEPAGHDVDDAGGHDRGSCRAGGVLGIDSHAGGALPGERAGAAKLSGRGRRAGTA